MFVKTARDYGFSASAVLESLPRKSGSKVRLYLDTSTLVKLIVTEAESAALNEYLQRFDEDVPFTAAVARTELVRAVADGGLSAVTQARNLLDNEDGTARLVATALALAFSGAASL